MTNKRSLNDRLRLKLFKDQIKEQKIGELSGLDDDLLELILNSAVVPNAVSSNAFRHTVFFHFLFLDKKAKKDKAVDYINKVVVFVNNLTFTERSIIKYGVVHRFKTNLWRTELFKYLKTPISLVTEATGRKILSGKKFKSTFFFAKKITDRGFRNERPTKF